ncbi:MAG: hypothetical protein M5U28_12155 [Sandaracinaceae bacterium]|nr:hypothetical protein [Sandaracinaceae bacterium]
MPRHDEDLDDDFDDDDLDDDPVAAEAERQQLIADYARLGRDVEDLQKRMDERYRGKTRWDRLALVGLALLSVGALMYVLTGSWLWTTLGVVLGVPALVIGAVVVLASVSEMRQRARAGRTKTLGEIRLVHDLEGQRVAMTHDLGAAQALVIYPALLDFAVTRWGVQYAPDDHGARLASRVARLASSALEQLEDGALPRRSRAGRARVGGRRPRPARRAVGSARSRAHHRRARWRALRDLALGADDGARRQGRGRDRRVLRAPHQRDPGGACARQGARRGPPRPGRRLRGARIENPARPLRRRARCPLTGTCCPASTSAGPQIEARRPSRDRRLRRTPRPDPRRLARARGHADYSPPAGRVSDSDISPASALGADPARGHAFRAPPRCVCPRAHGPRRLRRPRCRG